MFEGTLVVLASAEVPVETSWLGPREREALASSPLPRRRRDWLAGRWAARRAIAGAGQPVAGVEILAAEDGAPEAWIGARPSPVTVSITHRAGYAAALAAPAESRAGCDLETVEPRPPGFAADWFTPRELAFVDGAPAGERDRLIALTWSAKESVLKALRTGLRLDTREVEVEISGAGAAGDGWRRFGALVRGERISGWWRCDGRMVTTVVAEEKRR